MNTIQLVKRLANIEQCRECEHKMVNLDSDQLAQGDLVTLKRAGVRISNPNTDKAVCLNCEYKTFGRSVADFFESEDDEDDDSSFFGSTGSLGSFGGFGGFGGGSFGGAGASRGF